MRSSEPTLDLIEKIDVPSLCPVKGQTNTTISSSFRAERCYPSLPRSPKLVSPWPPLASFLSRTSTVTNQLPRQHAAVVKFRARKGARERERERKRRRIGLEKCPPLLLLLRLLRSRRHAPLRPRPPKDGRAALTTSSRAIGKSDRSCRREAISGFGTTNEPGARLKRRKRLSTSTHLGGRKFHPPPTSLARSLALWPDAAFRSTHDTKNLPLPPSPTSNSPPPSPKISHQKNKAAGPPAAPRPTGTSSARWPAGRRRGTSGSAAPTRASRPTRS